MHNPLPPKKPSLRKWTETYLNLNVIIPLVLIGGIIGFILYIWAIPAIRDKTAFWGVTGNAIPRDPEKKPTTVPAFPFNGTYGTIFTHKGRYTITPIAEYSVEARVLHTRHYYSTSNAGDLIPFDIALGWGLMSDVYALKNYFSFEHSNVGGRVLWIIPKGNYQDIPADYMQEPATGLHFSNNHIIPMNDTVFDTINDMSSGDHVRLIGYLVNVASQDNPDWYWKTAKYDRSDISKNFYWGEAGEPTCDTMFVTSAEIIMKGR